MFSSVNCKWKLSKQVCTWAEIPQLFRLVDKLTVGAEQTVKRVPVRAQERYQETVSREKEQPGLCIDEVEYAV